tara:strand:- start:174 stop:914 length:741 start_codon:yes stop_codon:yes gene_type:complete
MEKKKLKKFGLVGKEIKYSFSKKYFEKKFDVLNYDNFLYTNYDLKDLSNIRSILDDIELIGLNVTIPYKEKIIPYLDKLSEKATKIGAVNTIYFKNKKIIGDNTDVTGFEIALKSFMKNKIFNALVLGTGGASKAINFVLRKNKVNSISVSRKPKTNQIHYKEISKELLKSHPLIINCTPLGTYPSVNESPPLPYELIDDDNYLFDLIYNPETTLFMKKGLDNGAKVTNGLKMLIEQAEASWKLWK